MAQSLKPVKFSKPLLIVVASALIFMASLLFGIYNEASIASMYTIFLLFFITIFLAMVVVYLLWKKFHNEKTMTILRQEIDSLKERLNKADRLIEKKSDYLANMSHEIRIPLNSVLGMLKMLKKSNLDSEQMAEVEIAQYSSEHIQQLVDMISDNSKFVKENVNLELGVMDLESDLSKLFKVFEYQAWDKNIDFIYTFLSEKKSKSLLLGDIARIRQVLINLVNNAIKFTRSGRITVTIHQTESDDNNQIVTFSVKDTGVGMNSNEVKSVLNSDDGNYGGAGLLIAYKLVQLMGGELELESKENEGSVFYFSLQFKKTLNLKVENKETDAAIKNIYDTGFNVLVAEDNKINQKAIKFLLEEQGAECTLAKNGLEAVKLYNILDFDMVFMDIFMPEMDGYEATKTIKASDKYAKNKIPIIAVSASAFKADIKKAKASGVDDFLAKPIETYRLKELMFKYACVKKKV